MLTAVLIATVVGAVVGLLLGRRVFRPSEQVVRDPSGSIIMPVGPDVESLREAIDRLEVGVVISSASGEIVYRNTVASAMSGTHTGLIVDDHLARILDAAQSGGSTERIVELHGPPKQILAIEAKPVPTGGAVATIYDISERARTDAMRTDFVANISHELKTPVGAIAVLAETLEDETDAVVGRDLAGRLVAEAHRAVRTIDDLLELSQIESTQPANDVVDLTDVTAAAIARGRSLAVGSDIAISAIDMSSPILIRGDRPQLVSALGNLVENAVKYSSPNSSVQVHARCDDQWVEITVADQGSGIPARDLDRVFERFYRVDKARTRTTGGTGLGLAIVRHVATNHGGDVLVSSQEGEGSTFVLRIPADRVINESPARSESDAHKRADKAGAAMSSGEETP